MQNNNVNTKIKRILSNTEQEKLEEYIDSYQTFKEAINKMNIEYKENEDYKKRLISDYNKLKTEWENYVKNNNRNKIQNQGQNQEQNVNAIRNAKIKTFQERANDLINQIIFNKYEFLKLLLYLDFDKLDTNKVKIELLKFSSKNTNKNYKNIVEQTDIEEIRKKIKDDPNPEYTNIKDILKKILDFMGDIPDFQRIEEYNGYDNLLKEVRNRIKCIYNALRELILFSNITLEFSKKNIVKNVVLGHNFMKIFNLYNDLKGKHTEIISKLTIENLSDILNELILLRDEIAELIKQLIKLNPSENITNFNILLTELTAQITALDEIKILKNSKNTKLNNLVPSINNCLKQTEVAIDILEKDLIKYNTFFKENYKNSHYIPRTFNNVNKNTNKNKITSIKTLIDNLRKSIKNISKKARNNAMANEYIAYYNSSVKEPNGKQKLNNNKATPGVLNSLKKKIINKSKENFPKASGMKNYYHLNLNIRPPPPPKS
jgi:hypothetical protein